MLVFPIMFKICLFLITVFGIFRLFIKCLYKSKSKSFKVRLAVRKWLIIHITFLLVFGGEIILPSLSMMFLKYSKSNFAFFDLFSLEKYNINRFVREGCGGWIVSLLFLLIVFWSGR